MTTVVVERVWVGIDVLTTTPTAAAGATAVEECTSDSEGVGRD